MISLISVPCIVFGNGPTYKAIKFKIEVNLSDTKQPRKRLLSLKKRKLIGYILKVLVSAMEFSEMTTTTGWGWEDSINENNLGRHWYIIDFPNAVGRMHKVSFPMNMFLIASTCFGFRVMLVSEKISSKQDSTVRVFKAAIL